MGIPHVGRRGEPVRAGDGARARDWHLGLPRYDLPGQEVDGGPRGLRAARVDGRVQRVPDALQHVRRRSVHLLRVGAERRRVGHQAGPLDAAPERHWLRRVAALQQQVPRVRGHALHGAAQEEQAGLLPARLPPLPAGVGVVLRVQVRVRRRRVLRRGDELVHPRRHVRLLPALAAQAAVPVEEVRDAAAARAVRHLRHARELHRVPGQRRVPDAARVARHLRDGQHVRAVHQLLHPELQEERRGQEGRQGRRREGAGERWRQRPRERQGRGQEDQVSGRGGERRARRRRCPTRVAVRSTLARVAERARARMGGLARATAQPSRRHRSGEVADRAVRKRWPCE
mmetsp:Transcript_24184/g.83973  ORF Transcript_24184/g.83973 Transcript_24184/m.83973 type:complete len:343 (-) Transcript_24184:109-1137(-)